MGGLPCHRAATRLQENGGTSTRSPEPRQRLRRQPDARRPSPSCTRRLSRRRGWRRRGAAAATARTARGNHGGRGGDAGKAVRPPTPSRRRSCRTARPPAPTTPPATRPSSTTSSPRWTGRLTPASGACRQGRRRASPAFRAARAPTPSPTSRSGTGRRGATRGDAGRRGATRGDAAPRRSRPRPARPAGRALEAPPGRAGAPKTVTRSQEADGGYGGCSCAAVPPQPLPPPGRATGSAGGVAVFLGTAEGERRAHPRHDRRGEQRLANAQRRGSRPTTGSTRRKHAVQLLARAHQPVKRPRRDLHQQTARTLVRHYATMPPMSREDLRAANLVRHHPLAKSRADAGGAQFRSLLDAKAACAGRSVVAVPPPYTSQDCRRCGARVPQPLSVRTPICPFCGLLLDRAANGASNVLRAGQARRGALALAAAGKRASPGFRR
jgi:Putative transposase DNA-binding domain/Probable transposase